MAARLIEANRSPFAECSSGIAATCCTSWRPKMWGWARSGGLLRDRVKPPASLASKMFDFQREVVCFPGFSFKMTANDSPLPSLDDVAGWRLVFSDYYSLHCPENLKMVNDSFMAKWLGRYDELYSKLKIKYGQSKTAAPIQSVPSRAAPRNSIADWRPEVYTKSHVFACRCRQPFSKRAKQGFF